MPLQTIGSVIFYRDMLHLLSSSSIRIIFLFAALSAIVYGQNAKAQAWYSLDSKDSGFTIKFPQKPKFKSEPMAGGAITLNSYSIQVGDAYDFSAAYYDVPGFDEKALKAEFDIMAKGYFYASKPKVVSNSLVTQHGCEGKEFIAEGPLTRVSRLRIFVSGQRYYMVTLRIANNNANSKQVSDYFFDSLEISNQCKGGFTPAEVPINKSKIEYLDGVADMSTGWRKIRSENDAFDVLVPNRTELETMQVSTPFSLTKRLYSSYDKSTSYVISTIGEWPPDFITPKRQQGCLDIVEKILREELETATTKITFEHTVNIGTFPGREFSISSDTHVGRAQIFVTPKRTFMFINVAERKTYDPALTDRFLGSIWISVR